MDIRPAQHAQLMKKIAREEGFDFCGISAAAFLEDEAPKLEAWLKRGYQGSMSYLEKHGDKRLDPRLLVPGARSVVSLLYNYFPDQSQPAGEDDFKVARYAYGEDYHRVIKDKLFTVLQRLKEIIGDINGRVFVDSAPVMERAWAARGGLGWVGKNSLLINRSTGSYFFLAELIIDLELEPDGPIRDYCGSCTACQDACPTDAIAEPYVVDGSRCISYYTIELKGQIPEEATGKMNNWIFGCDICQEVCPWNRFSKPHRESRFLASPEMATLDRQGWLEMTEDTFDKLFRHSALQRTGFSGLKRNIAFASKGDK
jgi:epoxyqueuosine reductase